MSHNAWGIKEGMGRDQVEFAEASNSQYLLLRGKGDHKADHKNMEGADIYSHYEETG